LPLPLLVLSSCIVDDFTAHCSEFCLFAESQLLLERWDIIWRNCPHEYGPEADRGKCRGCLCYYNFCMVVAVPAAFAVTKCLCPANPAPVWNLTIPSCLMSQTLTAVTACEVFLLGQDEFDSLRSSYPALGAASLTRTALCGLPRVL